MRNGDVRSSAQRDGRKSRRRAKVQRRKGQIRGKRGNGEKAKEEENGEEERADVIPAEAGIHVFAFSALYSFGWIPAFVGMIMGGWF